MASIRSIAAILFGVSFASMELPADILVERSSSPTIATSSGIIIGSTSLYCPVFTKIVLFDFSCAEHCLYYLL